LLTISKPLSSGQAQTYHAKEFTSAEQNYWRQGDTVLGEWQGKMAERYGLAGAIDAQHFARFSEGQNPTTGEQLVRHRTGQSYQTADGTTVKPVEHRAGWDATFSAPKSVSLTALVGGDERIREAHRQAVTTALTELERYTQARIGGNHAAETTGKFIAAKFEHDTARPVDGYAAPQLHTDAVIFNMTEREDGSTRALQERGFFDTQQFATAVYQAELTYQLRNLGYQIEAGKSGAPEMLGWVQVQAHDVPHLLHEEGIGGEFKAAAAMGLQGERLKQAMHGGAGNPAGLGGLANAPVRAGGGFAGERAFEQGGDLLVLDAAWPARTQLAIESGQAVLDKPLSPLAHGGISPAQATGDLGIALSLSRPEHQFGPGHQSVWQSAGSGQTVQLGLFVRSESQSGLGASRDHVRQLILSPLLMLVIYGTRH
jgi:conjugative relaxase-like TrwC/TraI family protein